MWKNETLRILWKQQTTKIGTCIQSKKCYLNLNVREIHPILHTSYKLFSVSYYLYSKNGGRDMAVRYPLRFISISIDCSRHSTF